ncbi:MAG: hypothetical protein HY787_20155 [Deltaproteobacteria bacterium]|nr:hypothetical protein [Deltaproteobacteria bacterium]
MKKPEAAIKEEWRNMEIQEKTFRWLKGRGDVLKIIHFEKKPPPLYEADWGLFASPSFRTRARM